LPYSIINGGFTSFELSPETAENYNRRGIFYYSRKKYEEALADCTRAIQLNPETASSYFNRGLVYSNLEKYEEALADFSRAIELDPEVSIFYIQRANIYHDVLEKYEEALADYSRAIELNPTMAVYYFNRGAVYNILEKYEEALNDYNRALELEPKMELIYKRRGIPYLWMRNIKQATADFTSCWERNKSDIDSGLNGEWSRMCLERNERETIARLEAIVEIDPQCYASRVCKGAIFWLQEHFDQAKTELEQAILLEQDRWEAYFWQGMVDISLRMDESAIASLEGALEKGLPPVLLSPLQWLAQERSDFYEIYIIPLFARIKLII
jgi:tetratricopeptide (TPR) repeat protein